MHARDEDAGIADDQPTGLEDQLAAEPARRFLHHFRISGGIGRDVIAFAIGNAEAAAEIDVRNGVAVGAQFPHEIRQQRERIGERRQIGDLAADMHVDACHLQTRQACGMAIDLARPTDRNAEFVLGLAGRDLGMRLRIDIRIDADRDSDAAPSARCDLRQQVEFRLGFDVDAQDAGLDRGGQFGGGLADPGKHDLLRRNAGGQHALQLAGRHHVGAGTESRQRRDHALIGIGLDRVADQRRHVGKGVGEDAIMALQRRRRIAIERRTDRVGESGDIYRLGVKPAVAIGKMVHGGFNLAEHRAGCAGSDL